MRKLRTLVMLGALACAAGTLPAQQAKPAARTPHRLTGKTECLSCHGAGANQHVTSVPAAHKYANAACAACHRPAATMPPSSTHAMDAAHVGCAVCHMANSRVNAKASPASHAQYDAQTCSMCHETASKT